VSNIFLLEKKKKRPPTCQAEGAAAFSSFLPGEEFLDFDFIYVPKRRPQSFRGGEGTPAYCPVPFGGPPQEVLYEREEKPRVSKKSWEGMLLLLGH